MLALDHARTGSLPKAASVVDSRCDRLSVVIPLFNKATWIEAAVRSVLDDGDRVAEIIIVDDGSTDGGGDIVDGFDDPRVRLIRQRNGGVSRARNRGIETATSDWIVFLDADDYWLPGFGNELGSLAADYPDCAMLATSYVVADEQGRHRRPDDARRLTGAERLRLDDYVGMMSFGHVCCTNSIAVRRSLIQAAGLRFPEGEQLGEDVDFFFRVADLTAVAFSGRPLVAYRDAGGSNRLSHRRFDERVPPFVSRLESRSRDLSLPTVKRDGIRLYLTAQYEDLALASIREGRRFDALRFAVHPLLRARRGRWLALLGALLLPVVVIESIRRRRRKPV